MKPSRFQHGFQLVSTCTALPRYSLSSVSCTIRIPPSRVPKVLGLRVYGLGFRV